MGKLSITARRLLSAGVGTLLTLGILSGCSPVFLSQEVYKQAYNKENMLPDPRLEDNYCPPTAPVTASMAAPPTVNMPERKPRHLSLQEALAHALENGLPGGRTAEGRADTTLAAFSGPGSLINQTDRIRVLAMNPAISAAAIEASLARFDAVWVTGMNWTNTDNLQQGLSSFNNGHGANFNSSIIKAFADGSVANVSFLVNYTNLNVPPAGAFSVLNPNYTVRPSLSYEMPLWRDRGVEINQLLSRLSPITGQIISGNSVAGIGYNAHQGTVNSFVNGPTEGILISKLRFDQSRIEFERNIQILIKNTEIAYWNLYNKYGQLYSFEENLRLLQKAYQENWQKYRVGGGDLKPHQFFQSKGQYEEFRANRIQALQEVLDAERNLRGILGLAQEDGERLIPITPPTLAEMRPDWEHSLQDTLNLRPELLLARDNLRYHQYLLSIQKNNLKPDLRFFARYEPVGFGTSMTGSGTFIDGTGTERSSNALTSLRSLHFADYQLGLYLNVPLGQRAEHAAIRAARMQLAQSYYFLRDQEEKAVIYLTEQYQEVTRWHEQIKAHRAERQAYAEALTLYGKLITGGQSKATPGSLDFLSIQRSYAAALVKEYNAIAEYNNSLARLEYAKGTTLRYNNVHVSEGQLPEFAQVGAVDNEKKRSRDLVLRQRPDSLIQPGRMCATKESEVLAPDALPPVTVIEGGERPIYTEVPVAPSGSPFSPGVPIDFKPSSNSTLPSSDFPAVIPTVSPEKPATLPPIVATPVTPPAALPPGVATPVMKPSQSGPSPIPFTPGSVKGARPPAEATSPEPLPFLPPLTEPMKTSQPPTSPARMTTMKTQSMPMPIVSSPSLADLPSLAPIALPPLRVVEGGSTGFVTTERVGLSAPEPQTSDSRDAVVPVSLPPQVITFPSRP